MLTLLICMKLDITLYNNILTMKKKTLRSITVLIAFFSLVALSSCNRGYGCPNNFSLNDAASTVVNPIINFAKLNG